MRSFSGVLATLFLLSPSIGRAEADKPGTADYPMLSRMPHTHISGMDERDFDAFDFGTGKGQHTRVEGHKIKIDYSLDKGAEKPSALEIARNNQNALSSAGWTLLDSTDTAVTARLNKDGREIWVRVEAGGWGNETVTVVEKKPMPMVIEANKATPRAAGAPADAPNCKDYPGFPRLPGQRLAHCSESRFDGFDFQLANGHHRVEGRKLIVNYELDKGVRPISNLEMRGNYLAVLAQEGWVPLGSGEGWLTAVLKDKTHETWAKLDYNAGWGSSTLTVVEQAEMQQAVTANTLVTQLEKEGHVAFEVHFDTGDDKIKPESQPVLAQMVAVLKASSLKVEVQGHTDNVGSEKDNQALSERRAKSVMQALVAAGIDAARLTAKGYGQTRPVADNGTEGGRALNRRVELAKR